MSSLARPYEIALKWNSRVYEEFFVEGDADKIAGRPLISDDFDRDKCLVGKSTAGFIDFAVSVFGSEQLYLLSCCTTQLSTFLLLFAGDADI